jgi:phenylacetate-CoA ligase
LLRYRTGDLAELRLGPDGPVLVGLEGRPPVRFRTLRGEWINNIEVTHALRPFSVAQFALHQGEDGALRLRVAEPCPRREVDGIREALLALFGAAQPLEIEVVQDFGGKVVQYTSALAGAEL